MCIVFDILYLVQNQSIYNRYVNLTRSNGIDFKINKFLLLLSISLTLTKSICVSNGVSKIFKIYLLNGKKFKIYIILLLQKLKK